jgi:2-hydroxychromene-2-carboxylate isomerase
MNHVPFADKPAKCAYMWRDIERRAARYGIPARLPAPYPIANSERANLVAIVGMQEGWGQDPARVLAAAQSDEAKATLIAETNSA